MRLAGEMVAPLLSPSANPDAVGRWEARKAQRVFYCMVIAFTSARYGELDVMT
jgi:hypothetical protein